MVQTLTRLGGCAGGVGAQEHTACKCLSNKQLRVLTHDFAFPCTPDRSEDGGYVAFDAPKRQPGVSHGEEPSRPVKLP